MLYVTRHLEERGDIFRPVFLVLPESKVDEETGPLSKSGQCIV